MDAQPRPFVPPHPTPRNRPPTRLDLIRTTMRTPLEIWGEPSYRQPHISVKFLADHVVIANHPGGIADGVAVWQALREKRPDVCFFANRDALRVSPGLSDLIIPVEWRQNFRSRENARETLKSALEAFKSGRCVVIFPAGRMAEWSWTEWRLMEKPWMPTAVSFARRFGQPIIPLGVRQRMPVLYYALAQIHTELKDMTVFQGFIGKKGAHYPLRFGEPIDPKTLPESEAGATELIREACERLAWGR